MIGGGNTPNPFEVLAGLRDYYGTMHNHKEQMAYVATALLFGGLVTLGVQNPTVAVIAAHLWATGLLAGGGIGILCFIWFEFRARETAADIVAGCMQATARWGRIDGWRRIGDAHVPGDVQRIAAARQRVRRWARPRPRAPWANRRIQCPVVWPWACAFGRRTEAASYLALAGGAIFLAIRLASWRASLPS